MRSRRGFIAGASMGKAKGRLLVGNQGYNEKVGLLNNPHNDIALLSALEKVGFEVPSSLCSTYH